MITLLLAAATVQTSVDSCIVFSDRALVVRTGSAIVDAGDGEIEFPDLPGSLDENSIRLTAQDNVRLGEVRVKWKYEGEPSPRVKELQEKEKGLLNSRAALEEEKDVLRAKEKYLKSIQVSAPKTAGNELLLGKTDPVAWKRGLEFIGSELAALMARERTIKEETKELDKKLRAVRDEIADVREKEDRKRIVVVDYSGASGGRVKFSLSYIASGGIGWWPTYELRADPAEGKVHLMYSAFVAQRSGEDWEKVALVLSTAQPTVGQAPSPVPWYLRYEEVELQLERNIMNMPYQKAMQYEGFAIGDVVEEMDEERTISATPVETGISVQYSVPGRKSLLTGQPAKKYALVDAKMDARFEYFAFPRVSEHAYLTGIFENSTDFQFLPGESFIYVGNEYNGKGFVPSMAPGERDTVSFGADSRLKVVRKKVKWEKSRKGWFSKRINHDLEYEVIVENYNPKEVVVVLWDQIPVAQHKDIKVERVKIDPVPAHLDKGREKEARAKDKEAYDKYGYVRWYLTLAPKQKFRAKVSFNVSYPEKEKMRFLGL